MKDQVRLSIGSNSDWLMANVFLELMKELGISVHVSVASCHWSAGDGFTEYASNIEEEYIALMGGMSYIAAGKVESILRNLEQFNKITFGIPLDEAALGAMQDLPAGIPVLTCGFNKKDVKASIINVGLAMAKMIGRDNPAVRQKLALYYVKKRQKKGIVKRVELDANGLMPDPSEITC